MSKTYKLNWTGEQVDKGIEQAYESAETIEQIKSTLTEKADRTEVKQAVSQIVDGAPENFDTFKEIFDWITQHETKLYIITTRPRDPEKPFYGLGGGGEAEVQLEVSSFTGETEASVIVNGTEYNADNMSTNGETAKSGTLIIHKMEE